MNKFNSDIIFRNIILKFLAFVILGVLVIFAFNKMTKKMPLISIGVVLISVLAIETIQYFTHRGFCDIDGIILAMGGYSFGLFFAKYLQKMIKQIAD